MLKKNSLICALVVAEVILYAFVRPANNPRQENQPPVVKIIKPKTNSLFDYSTQINYEISVADKEDGNSGYDEINAKEVLLEVRYITDARKMQVMINKGVQNDPPGLALMRSSNCFNCHNFNSKSIGPSFNVIAAKYPPTPANLDTMVKKIRKGSTGIWGKDVMPSHSELTEEETKSIVQWTLKTAVDNSVNYYIGLTGSFRIKAPVKQDKDGSYLLTASYRDHGLKNTAWHHLTGRDETNLLIRR